MAEPVSCGVLVSRPRRSAVRSDALRWLAGVSLAGVLAACGGGGGGDETAGALRQALAPADQASCSYSHVYVTVLKLQVRKDAGGGESWIETQLASPQRIDLANLGAGVLQALGSAPLASGHYTEVRLVLASNDDGNGLANAVQPAGGDPAALTVPSGSQSGLKLQGDFVVPAGQAADVVLQGFDPCDAVVQAGKSGSYNLKPVLSATVRPAALAEEKRMAAGTTMPVVSGGFVVSRLQSANVWVLQRYGADGLPAGPETTGAPSMGPADSSPTIVALAGGGYAMTWLRLVEFRPDGGSLYQVYTQSFTSVGAPLGSPLAIAPTLPGLYFISRPIAMPQLAALTGGGYVVVWGLQSAIDTGVYARRFNADGTPAGAVHQVAPAGNGPLSVTGLATGGYMVTWGTDGAAGFARAYSSSDVPLGPAQPAGLLYVHSGLFNPTYLAPLAGGGAVMVWLRDESATSSASYEHVVQFSPDAAPLGAARIVDGSTAPAAPHNRAPAVAGLADGGYVVAWIEAGEVHARRFAADGAPAGAETRVNLVTTAVQEPIAVVALAGGGFMISWSGMGTDGVRATYSRVFTAAGLLG